MTDKPIASARLGPYSCPICGFNRGDKRHTKRCGLIAQREGKGNRFGEVWPSETPDRHLPERPVYVRKGSGFVRG